MTNTPTMFEQLKRIITGAWSPSEPKSNAKRAIHEHGLEDAHLVLMLKAPYSRPMRMRKTKALKHLLKLGLMEEHPEQPGVVRCTQKGEDFMHPFFRGRV